MKQLEVPFLSGLDRSTPIEDISLLLDRQQKHPIGIAPWKAFSHKPEVHFALAHANDCLFLKFYVKEKSLQARYSKINEPVYQDSCVEFFIAFNGEEEYYNFEFNCLGTCLSGYGMGAKEREILPEGIIARIKSLSSIKQINAHQQQAFVWRLSLMIPIEAFCLHEFTQLRGTVSRVNFYKCGDNLPERYYLSWNHIKSEEPDFHLPEFFGQITFN
jgi:hypothetical protein